MLDVRAYVDRRERGEAVLAPGHIVTRPENARRVARERRADATALRAEARQLANRAVRARRAETARLAAGSQHQSAESRVAAAEVVLDRLLKVLDESLAQRANLERALSSRIEIEQAKGILSERLRISLESAFDLIRRTARSNRCGIHEIARAVIEEPNTPARVLVVLHESLVGSRGRRHTRRTGD
jgi:hypothetical protein